MCIKPLVDIASPLENSNWLSPVSRLRVSVQSIARNLSSREEPNLDEIAVPFHSVDSASITIEAIAPGVGTVVMGLTPLVVALAGGLDVAVLGLNGASTAGTRNGTTVRGV